MAESARLICGSADVVEGGQGVRFSVIVGARERAAFVVRFEGRVRAFFNECAHVPVELDWKPGEFFDDSKVYLICSVHGALYCPESGQCLGGRCHGRGLTPIAVEEREGAVYLLP